jgi:competence protein ComEC
MGQGGWWLPAGLIAGAVLAQLFHSLPSPALILLLAVAGLAGLFPRRSRPLGCAVLACCWCLWHFHQRLEDRLAPELAGQTAMLTGTVASIPAAGSDYLSFRYRPDRAHLAQGIPALLQLRWYRNAPDLRVGQRWRLEIRVKPPWGRVNFQGGDPERWLFAQGIGALGTVRGGSPLPSSPRLLESIDTLRDSIRSAIARQLTNPRQQGVIQALAIAERSGMPETDQNLLRLTGTSHLLAISGLHVGLAAAGGYWLARLPLLLLPASRSAGLLFKVSVTGGLAGAAAYTALAGFGIPAMRALMMTGVVMAALSLSRQLHPMRAWTLALAGLLLLDPFAPMSAGFWFSFLAVAALLCLFHPRPGPRGWIGTLLLAQGGVFVALMPVGVAWYQFYSPLGFVANLVAIPWVSLLVVPATLSGVAALFLSEAVAGGLWTLGGFLAVLLFDGLEFLVRLQGSPGTLSPPPIWQTVLACSGSLLLLLPRGITWRWYGVFMILPLFLPSAERTKPGEIELEVLDVGQGTAALLSSGSRSLLYDSGPGDGQGRDLVASVIAPALARLGHRAPERIVISHGDLDHAGGLGSLLSAHSRSTFLASLSSYPAHIHPCRAPDRWAWPKGMVFQTLHPTRGLPYLGNDSSCVISVHSDLGGILLSGDISDAIESRLVRQGLGPHRVLLIPHHGSAGSSGATFIDGVIPEIAIATASLGNRFDFPRATVRDAYESRGAQFWSTGECGAIRLRLLSGGRVVARSARRERQKVWRYPATPNCP